MRAARAWAVVLAVAATGLAAALAVGPAHLGDLAWRWLLIFLGGLGAALLVGWLAGLAKSPVEIRPKRRKAPAGLPENLVSVQDAVRSGASSRADFERVLRPLLSEIAEDRFLALGISPERQPEAARARGGQLVADLLLSPRQTVYGTRQPGPGRPALERLVADLEGLRR
jgi:MFS family permease